MKQVLDELGLLLDLGDDVRVDAFPEAGRREHERRLHALYLLGQARQTLAEVDRHSEFEWHQLQYEPLCNVRAGQEGDGDVSRP